MFDEDFRQAAARIVRETGKPIAQVARDWESTSAHWVSSAPRTRAAVTPRPEHLQHRRVASLVGVEAAVDPIRRIEPLDGGPAHRLQADEVDSRAFGVGLVAQLEVGAASACSMST
jgi:hypothetical protein